MRASRSLFASLCVAFVTACGGGGGGSAAAPAAPDTPVAAVVDPRLDQGNAGFQTVLSTVPAAGVGGGGGATPTTLTIHYRRPTGDYTGWTLHAFNAAVETGWTFGLTPTATDAFGKVFEVALKANSGTVGYIFHNGDIKDHTSAPGCKTSSASPWPHSPVRLASTTRARWTRCATWATAMPARPVKRMSHGPAPTRWPCIRADTS